MSESGQSKLPSKVMEVLWADEPQSAAPTGFSATSPATVDPVASSVPQGDDDVSAMRKEIVKTFSLTSGLSKIKDEVVASIARLSSFLKRLEVYEKANWSNAVQLASFSQEWRSSSNSAVLWRFKQQNIGKTKIATVAEICPTIGSLFDSFKENDIQKFGGMSEDVVNSLKLSIANHIHENSLLV